jgi:hypothetical protein
MEQRFVTFFGFFSTRFAQIVWWMFDWDGDKSGKRFMTPFLYRVVQG